MGLDADLLAAAAAARDRLVAAQHAADQARADYHHAVRRLHATGGTLREIAAALRLSHQRVHQIVEELPEAATRRRWLRRQRRPGGPCSFCGRPRAAVARLVAGPGVCICDGCVVAAGRAAGGQAPGDPTRPLRLERPDGQGPCSFCGRPAGQARRLVGSLRPAAAGKAGGPARICEQCLALCEEILGEAAWP